MLSELDHVAIVVPDTNSALALWRSRLGMKLVVSEVVNNGSVRLTHLDAGATHLQLVQPLVKSHPLAEWLNRHGPGLHHVCFRVADVDLAMAQATALGTPPAQVAPHQAVLGKRAFFLDDAHTGRVRIELVGP